MEPVSAGTHQAHEVVQQGEGEHAVVLPRLRPRARARVLGEGGGHGDGDGDGGSGQRHGWWAGHVAVRLELELFQKPFRKPVK